MVENAVQNTLRGPGSPLGAIPICLSSTAAWVTRTHFCLAEPALGVSGEIVRRRREDAHGRGCQLFVGAIVAAVVAASEMDARVPKSALILRKEADYTRRAARQLEHCHTLSI